MARDYRPSIPNRSLNSVEALGPFAISAVLAMFVGVGPVLLAALVWLHLVIRLGHLFVYLRGGEAAKGGKLRTVLYVAAGLVTILLILATAWSAVS
jgi:uncharacterized MAPEG superfamily protein